MPSSITKKPKNLLSNKRLYFLTMLSQYNLLKNYSEGIKLPSINACPNFHTSVVNYKQRTPLKHALNLNKNYNNISTKNYPELSLPLVHNSKYPTVKDIVIKSKDEVKSLLKKALAIHLQKMHKELDELCEYGSSENYRIYENLFSYIKKNKGKFVGSKRNMKILLKTTLFSNKLLIESLRDKSSRMPASINNKYLDEIVRRLNAHWAYNYINTINQRLAK